MYTHLTEQLADQRRAELHARSGHAQPHPQGRAATARRQHRHPIRRRAGYALVSLGLRLAYVAGED
jgi:hypothetical protein